MIRPLLVALAITAPTHVEPQSSEAPAGARTTFGFVVEHGCEGSPTVEVAIQVPDGAFDVAPRSVDGWTGTMTDDGRVVTFSGGPLPDDVPATFEVELVTPNRPGDVVLFPTVQSCEVGAIAWIDPTDGAAEPAPRVLLTANDQPILPTTTAPPAPSSTTPAEPATTTAPTDSTAAAAAASSGDDDGDSATPALVIAGVALVAAAGVGAVASRRRARR